MSLTPHGPGFAFLDAFAVTVPGRQGVGEKWLDPESAFFTDHFPGEPLMPGVLLVECGAQAAGALWGAIRQEKIPVRFTLAQILQFRLMQPVFPDERVTITVELEKMFGTLAQFGVVLAVEGREVARGSVVLSESVSRSKTGL